MTKEPTDPAPRTAAFQVPPDLADTDLTLTQVRSIVLIRRSATKIQNRIDAIPAKKAALEADLGTLRNRERAIKSGQPDPASLPIDPPDTGEAVAETAQAVDVTP